MGNLWNSSSSDEMQDSDDEQYQEAIVNNKDAREAVHRFVPKLDDIYHKIGEIVTTYDYKIPHKYRKTAVGTGTVIFARAQNNNAFDDCYILTAAHNIRRNVLECTECKLYRETKDKNCENCQKNKIHFTQMETIIKATRIEFLCHDITVKDFGETLVRYECTEKEIFIDEYNYNKYSKPKHGYDYAILHFADDKHKYIKKIDNIRLTKTYKNATELCIFGYPKSSKGEMLGMKSKNINQFEIIKNDITNKKYIQQNTIDTAPGQSGSIIFWQDGDVANIIGLHVGGRAAKNVSDRYNIATLINEEIIEKVNHIKCNNKMDDHDEKKFENNTPTLQIGANSVMINMEFNVGDDAKIQQVAAEIKLKSNIFVERYVEFSKKQEILGLQPDADYMIRFRMKYGNNWSPFTRIIEFKTMKYQIFNKNKGYGKEIMILNDTTIHKISRRSSFGWSIISFGTKVSGEMFSNYKLWFNVNKIEKQQLMQFCICYAASIDDITVWEEPAYGLTDTANGLVAIKAINNYFYLYDEENNKKRILFEENLKIAEFPSCGSKFFAEWNFIDKTFALSVKKDQQWMSKIKISQNKNSIVAVFALWGNTDIKIVDYRLTMS
eukprot:398589_1